MPSIPIDFVLVALTLAGVALFHHHTLKVAVSGLAVLALYKVLFAPFREGAGLAGLGTHLVHEWVVIANLGLLLTGFALLARPFEESGVPEALPRVLPSGWGGGFALLGLVFVLSSFLDNIAAALIGATVAKIVFPSVHIGYLAAIVAASNVGGSGSVVGDTTTTMMWIDGVSPLDVTHAYMAASPALVVCGLLAARRQHAHAPMRVAGDLAHAVDWGRIGVVAVLLVAALAANIGVNATAPDLVNPFPVLGVALWAAILVTAACRTPDWRVLPSAVTGAIFLPSLVLAASTMPVKRLPAASWQTAFGLGFRFGSSAGVAVTNVFPEGQSVAQWIRQGWHVALAHAIGFAVPMLVWGWQPHEPHRAPAAGAAGVEAH